jgi:hypothetical protein
MENGKLVYDPNAQSLPTDSAAIVDKINNGDLKIKGKNKSEKKHKVPLPEKVHKALEKIAEAEGKTPDEKVAEIVKEKAKPKPKPEKPATPVFPADARINDYGFLGFKAAWLETLSWHKGMALKIDKNADGSVTLTKA